MERLNETSLLKIDRIVAEHRNEPGPVIVMLHEVQDTLGYVPFEAILKIAEATGKSPAEVLGVVEFYAGFTTMPKGKHVINVCLGTACYVKGSQKLADEAVKVTGAELNSTSADGMFSVDATRCVGACGLAPVCIVDGRVIAQCTPQIVAAEVKRIREEEKNAGAAA